MDTVRSYTPRTSEIVRAWYVIDATGRPLGRLASQVAQLLRGKHKATYSPHMDVGDHVIVLLIATETVGEKRIVQPLRHIIKPPVKPVQIKLHVNPTSGQVPHG